MALPASAHRPFVLIQTLDQWRRCSHEQTWLDVLGRSVELARLDVQAPADPLELGPLPSLAGLGFDRRCRLLRAMPEPGQVALHRWQPPDSIDPLPIDPQGRELFASPSPSPNSGPSNPPLGEFNFVGDAPGPLASPSGLAIDGLDRLYVWESARGGLLIWDLEAERIRERISLGMLGPVDLAWIGDRLLGVGPGLSGLLERGNHGQVRVRALPSWIEGVPARIAGDSRGRSWLLLDAGTADARIVMLEDPSVARAAIAVPGASDLEFRSPQADAERLVVAPGPAAAGGESRLRSFVIAAGMISEGDPLAARGYDGRGIVRTPDDRILYYGARGLRHAVAAAPRYAARGRVIGFRLDAGEYQARWGRVFIDACVPKGTELRIATVVTDDPPDAGPADRAIDRQPPSNEALAQPKQIAGTPMPPDSLVPDAIEGRLVERTQGRELPWTIRDDRERKHVGTWEGVVQVGSEVGEVQALGRWLWVFVELRGNGRRTPSLRCLRVERSGHGLLDHLPKIFSRDPLASEFLWRMLAPFDGSLVDLELRTSLRHALLHPRSSPEPFLPWLAELLGLVLDERWPVAARRQVIAEATWLFRFRGTVPGLRRMLEIYLGAGRVWIVEQFQLRGPQGSFSGHAHRFTVLVLDSLTPARRSVVEHILDQHRPAHTLYQLCTVDSGLRVGVGLHVGLSSVVGASSRWHPLQVGASSLDGSTLLGQARIGVEVANARLGQESRVG